MLETTMRAEDACIEEQNFMKALYYKWLTVDGLQRNRSLLELQVW